MTMRGYFLGADWSRQGVYTGTLEDLTAPGTGLVAKGTAVTAEWGRGEGRAIEDSTASKLAFTVNNHGRQFSNENPSSPIAGKVLPGTPVTLAMTVADAMTTLLTGVIDGIDDSDPRAVAFTAMDGWNRPGKTTLSTPVYQGLRTGDLIGVILDTIGWTGGRDIDPGATVVPYWWAEGTDAATAVDDLVHSEGPPAIAYVQAGTFVFRDRHHRLTRPASTTSQATYSHLKPSGIWTPASDTFTRTVSSGWGNADTGQAWTVSGGVASDFNVGSGVGTQSHSAVNVSRRAVLASVTSEQIQATVSVPAVATGASLNAAVTLRNLDPSTDHYRAQLAFGLAGAMTLTLIERSGGGDSTLATVTLADIYAAGTRVTVAARMDGTTLRAKAWLTGAAEPGWQVTASDATIGSGYPPGVRTVVSTGNTNTLPVVFSVDDVIVTPTDSKILKDSFAYDNGLTGIINSASIEVAPRIPQNVQVVWKTDDPITLGTSETRTIVVQTSDPFILAQTPSALISYLDDGTYTYDYRVDAGSVASVTLSRDSGQSLYLTITAGAGGAVLLGGIKLRATPLTAGAAYRFANEDASSVGTFGRNTWQGSAPWAGIYDADVISQRIVGVYAQARPTVVLSIAGVDLNHLTDIARRTVSDRVTVRNDAKGISADFVVERVSHQIRQLIPALHTMTIACSVVEPQQPANVFTFDLAGAGFNDGSFGMIGVTSPGTMFTFDVAGKGFNDGVFAA